MDNLDCLINCPCCSSDACYEKVEDGITTWLCMTCGFASCGISFDGSEYDQHIFNTTADLIRDLRQVHDNLSWYPSVINVSELGMVFPEWNKRAQDWYWAAVKAIEIPEEERSKYPDPNNIGQFHKYKMDTKSITHYGKYDFMDALETIGIFNK